MEPIILTPAVAAKFLQHLTGRKKAAAPGSSIVAAPPPLPNLPAAGRLPRRWCCSTRPRCSSGTPPAA